MLGLSKQIEQQTHGVTDLTMTASNNLRHLYTLSSELSTDEAMVAFSGRLSLKGYMTVKSIRQGIKV